jgi:folate-binding protein YgfZ
MAAQTIFTNEKGKVLDSVFVARQTDGIILIGHENKSKLLAFWMNKFIIGDDVKIADISGENYILEFLGPQALPLLMYLFGESINPLKAGASVPVGIKSYALQVLAPEQTAGKIAYWVMGSPVALIDVLETCFSNSILFDFKMIGIEAYEEYRIENGIIDSRELTDQFNPYDLDIIRDVSFTKGCYIGQEVIARLDTYKKTQKSLRTFILKEVIPANGAFDIVDERGNVIGALTSATQSSRRNGSIGIGIIQNEYNKAGTEVRIKNSTVSIPAIVKEIHPL